MLQRRLVMTFSALAAGSALTVLSLVPPASLSAAAALMSVDDVRPGMVGIGHTVFDGTHVEDFKAHIIGVLQNMIGPGRNLILAKLEGGPLAQTGVIAGMSGSPVYVDGKLIGAVSYALGSFPKEAIAGITPIGEMTDAAALPEARPAAARVRLDYPLTRENLTAAFRKALNWNRPFADRPDDIRASSFAAVDNLAPGQIGALMRPIATPLVMSGFEPEVADLLGSAFREQGFIPTGAAPVAGTARGEKPYEGPLRPGDAVGVMLVGGDLMLGGTGTVTHIDGDKVYAFGHPMYGLGPTEFPMTRAYVYTILPSLFSSMKLSSPGEVIGTVLQDRATAISGRLGPGPRMLPVSISLERRPLEKADGRSPEPKRSFKFTVVNDPLFGPLMTYATLLNTLMNYERNMEAATFSVRGTAKIRGHEPITFDNIFAGDQSSVNAAAYVISPVIYLMGNDFEKVDVEGLDLSISTVERPETAVLERAWLDDPRPRAGRTVPLKVLLRTYRGADEVRTIPIQIPANASGSLSLLVSDGARLGLAEQREARSASGKSVDQVIRSLNKGRRNNTLYVKLLSGEAGAVVSGEALSALPPSVLNVLEGERNGGNFSPLHSATLGEWELATEHAVSGSKTLAISISQN